MRRQSNHVKSKYEKSSHVKSNLSHFTASNTSLHAKWHKLRILVLKLQLQCIRPCSSCAGNHWLLLPPDFSVTLVGNRGTYLSKGRKTLLSLSIFQLQGQNPGTLVTSPIADQWILIPVIPQNMVQPMVQWSNRFGYVWIHHDPSQISQILFIFRRPSLDELKHRLILTAGSSHCETHCVTT